MTIGECDCCGKGPRFLSNVIAYGIETAACQDCTSSEVYHDHTLPSGEIMTITSEGDHPTKRWQVACYAAGEDGEFRWSVDFPTEEEAIREYQRFD